MNDTIYYAHTTDQGKETWQTVKDHLINTANIAVELGRDAGLQDFAYLAGLLHDIGKYSLAFQRRLEGYSGKVDHATAGAQAVMHLLENDVRKKYFASLLAYCITGHHGGMPDYGSRVDVDTEGTLCGRLKKKVSDYSGYANEIDISPLKTLPQYLPFRPIKQSPGFSIAFFTRILYSTLVDADFLETETFMNGGTKPRGDYDAIPELAARLNRFLERFINPQNPIHARRTEILNICLTRAAETPGMYKLTVPTGGGKTYASMAFALNHANTHGMKRIIYVIPYTSIIEQNAGLFEDILGQLNVLEHHSNLDWEARAHRAGLDEFDENIRLKLKLAAENWDIPIVVTTNVQFFESIFANRSSRCRKLHNLARSVIIFDEAQMLPREYLQPCMYAVSELVRNYGATTVFCTATQPELERFLPESSKVIELVPDPEDLYVFFKRVKIESLGKISDSDLLSQIHNHTQALCIVNTRKHAKGLFEGVEPEGRFHLSTLMCPAHRRRIITEIRERLKERLPCRVISTQIMEAGIDVDFPVGYRSLAGLDSVIQAAGRVNREGKQASGTLYIFEPVSEYVKRAPAYIQQGAEVTKWVLREHVDDPSSLAAIRAYYNRLYDLQNDNAFDSLNIIGRFEKGVSEAIFEFESAAKDFKIIRDDTAAVIIPYNAKAEEILSEVRLSDKPLAYMRRLQPYTVNIYEREFNSLQAIGAIDIVNDTFSVLNRPDLYSSETGLLIPESGGGEAIFFDG